MTEVGAEVVRRSFSRSGLCTFLHHVLAFFILLAALRAEDTASQSNEE